MVTAWINERNDIKIIDSNGVAATIKAEDVPDYCEQIMRACDLWMNDMIREMRGIGN